MYATDIHEYTYLLQILIGFTYILYILGSSYVHVFHVLVFGISAYRTVISGLRGTVPGQLRQLYTEPICNLNCRERVLAPVPVNNVHKKRSRTCWVWQIVCGCNTESYQHPFGPLLSHSNRKRNGMCSDQTNRYYPQCHNV